MVPFPIEAWVALAVLSAGTVLAILGCAAMARREECRRHDLKVRVHELRAAYQRRMAELRREAAETVDEPSAPAPDLSAMNDGNLLKSAA